MSGPTVSRRCWFATTKRLLPLYKAALDELLGPDTSIAIFSDVNQRDETIPQIVKDLDMDRDTRAKAIREFRKLSSDNPEDQGKEEQRWRRAEIIIVCDMLLTGFDAPIVQTMYLDKGLRNHGLLQAIARINRPYNELKKEGLIRDFWGVFSHLNEALRYDKSELGDVAFPLRVVREEFKLHIETVLELVAGHERSGSHPSLMRVLAFFNKNEPARDKFENGYAKDSATLRAARARRLPYAISRRLRVAQQALHGLSEEFYPLEKF